MKTLLVALALAACDAAPGGVPVDAAPDALVCDPDASADPRSCVCYCLAKYPGATVAQCAAMCPDAG